MGSLSGMVEARKEKDPIQNSKGSYRPNFRSSDRSPRLPPLKVGYKHSLDKEIDQLLEAVSLKGTPKNTGLSQVGTRPLQKNALKKPITNTTHRSPEIGFSEPTSLKKTLRDVCVSKASGVAAMRRLTQSADFSGASEAGRIKSLYNSVVVESNQSGLRIKDSKGRAVKISFLPEDRKPNSSPKTPEHIHVPKVSSLSKSAHSSPRLTALATPNSAKTILVKNEIASDSRKVGIQNSKKEIVRKDRSGSAPSHSNTLDNVLDGNENISSSTKVVNKVKSSSPGHKGRLLRVSPSDSIDGNKASKSSRKVKPKDLVNTMVKPDSSTLDTGINASGVSTSQLLCERCNCSLKTNSKESETNSMASIYTSLATELSSSNATSSIIKQSIALDSSNRSETPSSLNSSHGEYSTSTASFSYDSSVRRSSCSTRPHMSKDLKWGAIRHIRQQGAVGLKHFKILKKLGAGDIGDVYLAKLIGTNCLFAIKVMDNEFLERRQKMPRVQTERKVLKMLDHPFLPTLYAHFTSDNLSCLVMDYCPGGDLHVLRQKQPGGTFPESAARFYVGEVLLAVEYLHMLGVIYRDLKPENVLVREDGHIMLTDFDLSLRCSVNPTLLKASIKPDLIKLSRQYTESSNSVDPFCMVPSCQVSCFSPRFLPSSSKSRKLKPDPSTQTRSLPQLIVEPTDARSNSFVGTHEYLAPEIIQGEGHGAAVDWWTLGIFLYELLYGRTPFRGSNNEETLANVVLQRLDFPDSPPVSSRGRDLIRRLLVKEAKNRFGSEKGAAEIKQHPFFHGLNWALIRCACPPELPELFDYDVTDVDVQEENRYLECKANGDHLEFELF